MVDAAHVLRSLLEAGWHDSDEGVQPNFVQDLGAQDGPSTFSGIVAGSYRGTLDMDIKALDAEGWVASPAPKPQPWTEFEKKLIRRLGGVEQAQQLSSIFYRGRRYATGTTTPKAQRPDIADSTVSFRTPAGEDAIGRIYRLISFQVIDKPQVLTDMFAFVRTFKPLSSDDASKNPYADWPEFCCHLMYDRFDESLHVIPVRDILPFPVDPRYSSESSKLREGQWISLEGMHVERAEV